MQEISTLMSHSTPSFILFHDKKKRKIYSSFFPKNKKQTLVFHRKSSTIDIILKKTRQQRKIMQEPKPHVNTEYIFVFSFQ